MCKRFCCIVGVFKALRGLLLPMVNHTANHALRFLPALDFIATQKLIFWQQFFWIFYFLPMAWAIIFFNFVYTKSGRQGDLLGFSEKVEIKWTGRSARFILKTTFSDRQGDLLSLFHTYQFRRRHLLNRCSQF